MRAGAHGVLSSSVDWILRYMYKHNLNTIKSINQKFIQKRHCTTETSKSKKESNTVTIYHSDHKL